MNVADGLGLVVCVSAFAFSQRLAIDISRCKIILEVKYFIKSMIYQTLKFLKRIACFIPRLSEDLYFDLKIQKIQVN